MQQSVAGGPPGIIIALVALSALGCGAAGTSPSGAAGTRGGTAGTTGAAGTGAAGTGTAGTGAAGTRAAGTAGTGGCADRWLVSTSTDPIVNPPAPTFSPANGSLLLEAMLVPKEVISLGLSDGAFLDGDFDATLEFEALAPAGAPTFIQLAIYMGATLAKVDVAVAGLGNVDGVPSVYAGVVYDNSRPDKEARTPASAAKGTLRIQRVGSLAIATARAATGETATISGEVQEDPSPMIAIQLGNASDVAVPGTVSVKLIDFRGTSEVPPIGDTFDCDSTFTRH